MKEIEYKGKCLLINSKGKRVLVIGDLHLGYEGALNEAGVYIGRNILKENLKYMDRIFEKIGRVDEIILLGDVKHVIGSVINQEWNEVLGFLDYLRGYCNKIVVVKGQHDAILGPILSKRKGIELLDYYIDGKYAFVHGDRVHGDKEIKEIENKEIIVWIVGNGHPAVRITDGTKMEKYKCFLVGKYKGKEIIICPSFIEANEGTDPREYDLGMGWKFDYNKFNVVAVGEDLKDLDFGKLKKLK